ncbi:hypothetical protein IE53DRAFT_31120 [Violaceomyces palustris]|uniref:Uncharacterized protein n=1 Tax=Violaceomyces palustris TaxID=1673888 RepID=A0ACD0P1C0_9BASI|nr:hypothetical protein IE53DRAFT_31120 [Violaceomyces palustris]
MTHKDRARSGLAFFAFWLIMVNPTRRRRCFVILTQRYPAFTSTLHSPKLIQPWKKRCHTFLPLIRPPSTDLFSSSYLHSFFPSFHFRFLFFGFLTDTGRKRREHLDSILWQKRPLSSHDAAE